MTEDEFVRTATYQSDDAKAAAYWERKCMETADLVLESAKAVAAANERISELEAKLAEFQARPWPPPAIILIGPSV